MEIQIITKKIKSRMIRNLFPSPAIFEKNIAHWVLHIKMKNFTGQEIINVQPSLLYGEGFKRFFTGSRKPLDIKEEQKITIWRFISYESGKSQLQLMIDGLDPEQDVILDDYRSRIRFIRGQVIYLITFNVYSFLEYSILWFAFISAIGAITEIINISLTHNIHKHIIEIFYKLFNWLF